MPVAYFGSWKQVPRARNKRGHRQRNRRSLLAESLEQRRFMACDAGVGLESVCAGADVSAQEGELVTLEAAFTNHEVPAGTLWQWTVLRSDGSTVATGSDQSVSFIVSDDGVYTAIVSATHEGVTVSDSLRVKTANAVPVLTVTGPLTTNEGAPYQLNLAAADPGDDTISSWTIDWGDGSDQETFPGGAQSATHMYSRGPGNYLISATATDEDGQYKVFNGSSGSVTQLDASFGNAGEIRLGAPGDGSSRMRHLFELADGRILAVGEILAGGDGGVLARFDSNGALDASFGQAGIVLLPGITPGTVEQDSQGRIVIATNDGVYRYSPAGALDKAFGTNGRALVGSFIHDLAIDSADRVVFYSGFNAFGRLLPGGQVDPTFVASAISYWPSQLAFDAQDRLVLTGEVELGTKEDIIVTRLSSSGALDTSFGNQGHVIVDFEGRHDRGLRIAFWNDKAVIAGRSAGVRLDDETADIALIRLNADGSRDSSFGADGILRQDFGGFEEPSAIYVSGDGSITLSGRHGRFSLAEFDASGAVNTVRFDGPLDAAHAISKDSNGRILQGGIVALPNGSQHFALARFKVDGSVDTDFGTADADQVAGVSSLAFQTGAAENVLDIAVDFPDGAMLVGAMTIDSQQATVTIKRYLASGVLDTSFGIGGNITINATYISELRSLAVDSSGRILALVQHHEAEPGSLLRFLADGTPDPTFGNGNGKIPLPVMVLKTMALASNDDIVVGGQIMTGPQANEFCLFSVAAGSGVLRTDFGVNGLLFSDLGEPGEVNNYQRLQNLAIDTDGRILVSFRRHGTIPLASHVAVARYTSHGMLDVTFGAGATYRDGALLESRDGLVAARRNGSLLHSSLSFDSFGRILGASGFDVFRLTDDGVMDGTFGHQGEASIAIEAFDIASDDLNHPIVVGQGGITRLTSNGVNDFSFAPGSVLSLPGHTLNKVSIDAAGRIVAGGKSTGPDGSDDLYIARIIPAQAAIIVEVRNVAPQAIAGPDEVYPEGELVTLHATAVDPGSHDSHLYRWRVVASNGQVFAEVYDPSISFVLEEEGTYTATLTVTDSDGASSTDEVVITAAHVPSPSLACDLLEAGLNTCTLQGGRPGAVVRLASSTQPRPGHLPEFGVNLDIADAQIVGESIIQPDGSATFQVFVTSGELDDRVLFQAFTQAHVTRTSNVVIVGSPLRVAEGSGQIHHIGISPAEVASLRAAAIAAWEATDLSFLQSHKLRFAEISITDLPGDVLGQTIGDHIYVDVTAAGHLWFVDETPDESSEFPNRVNDVDLHATPDSVAAARIDLLTVLMHEMGHVLGEDDLEFAGNHELMSADLSPGTRRIPAAGIAPYDAFDVTRDGFVTPFDALVVINRLNSNGGGQMIDDASIWHDVDRDGFIAPIDALLLINRLNAHSTAQSESSSTGAPAHAAVGDSFSEDAPISAWGATLSSSKSEPEPVVYDIPSTRIGPMPYWHVELPRESATARSSPRVPSMVAKVPSDLAGVFEATDCLFAIEDGDALSP